MKASWSAVVAQWRAATLEFLRSKLYAGLLAAGFLLILAAVALAELSLGETVNALTDLGLAFVALVTAGLGGAVTISAVSRVIASREAIAVLARPISRDTFVVSRFLASATLVLSANLLLGGLLAGLVAWFGGHWVKTLVAALAASLEGILVCGVAMVFAVRSSAVLSASLTAVFFVLGRMDTAFFALLEKGTFGALEKPMRVVHHVLPQLSRFDLTAWLHGDAPDAIAASTCVYGLMYAAMLVLFASWRFHGRDIL